MHRAEQARSTLLATWGPDSSLTSPYCRGPRSCQLLTRAPRGTRSDRRARLGTRSFSVHRWRLRTASVVRRFDRRDPLPVEGPSATCDAPTSWRGPGSDRRPNRGSDLRSPAVRFGSTSHDAACTPPDLSKPPDPTAPSFATAPHGAARPSDAVVPTPSRHGRSGDRRRAGSDIHRRVANAARQMDGPRRTPRDGEDSTGDPDRHWCDPVSSDLTQASPNCCSKAS